MATEIIIICACESDMKMIARKSEQRKRGALKETVLEKEKLGLEKKLLTVYSVANSCQKKFLKMKNWLKNIKFNEATISMVLGVVVVTLVGLLMYNYMTTQGRSGVRERTSSTSTETGAGQAEEQKPENGTPVSGSEYTVQRGDSLWKIAVKTYGDGYKWTEIQKANQAVLKNPNLLLTGVKLQLPKLEQAQLAETEKAVTQEYKIVKGDSLWSVAQRVCRDGFAWEGIATDNKIENPRRIEIGTVLKVSCPPPSAPQTAVLMK